MSVRSIAPTGPWRPRPPVRWTAPWPSSPRAVHAGRALDITARIDILDALRRDFGRVARRWVEACLEAEHIPAANPLAGEEWIAGPYLVLRNMRLLQQALRQVREQGHPRIPGPVTTRGDGQVVAQVFPEGVYDRIFYPPGMTAEVWMEPGVTWRTNCR